MTAHHIRYAVDGEGIATLTIDRAEKRNAMTYAMLNAFIERVAEAGADEAVRVVIVTGAGGAFCAGTDLADLATIPGESRGVRGEAREGGRWWPLVQCPKPVIGAIDGAAVGMGAEFSSQCDVRIVSTRARFAWNFAHRGLVPDTGAGSWLLPRLIGPHRALRLLYSGAFLEAEEAQAIGYAAEVVAPEALAEAALAEARRYLASSPFSLRRMKDGLARPGARCRPAHGRPCRGAERLFPFGRSQGGRGRVPGAPAGQLRRPLDASGGFVDGVATAGRAAAPRVCLVVANLRRLATHAGPQGS